MPKVIIADTSCLIVLDNIGELQLLNKLYGEILITPEIESEFGKPIPEWFKVRTASDRQKQNILELELDNGEASAIALCLEEADCLLIIDERKGRNVAKRLGIAITGTLGVILKCKNSGLIKSVSDILLKLEENNFRISKQLKETILKKSNE